MKRLAVFLPGIGYTVDKPLMHYSRRLAEKHGFEIRLLPYSGFPKKVKGDKDKMQESYKIALKQAKVMLSDGILFALIRCQGFSSAWLKSKVKYTSFNASRSA